MWSILLTLIWIAPKGREWRYASLVEWRAVRKIFDHAHLSSRYETDTPFLILSLGCRMTRSPAERPDSTSGLEFLILTVTKVRSLTNNKTEIHGCQRG
jgi:hypothetical protein